MPTQERSREDIKPTLLCGGRIAYAVAWDIGVTVFSAFEWTDPIAANYIEECLALTQAASVVGGRGGLTYVAAKPPGASQRRIIVDALRRHGVRVESQRSVILTDSATVRGAATALSWLTGSDTHAFPTAKLDEAVAYAAFGEAVLAARVHAYLWKCLTLLDLKRP